jgi:hypothetical protein
VFEAFCRQAGIARCDTLGTLCETLKLFHVGGPLPGRKVLVMGASGGDMAMTADVSRTLDLDFAPIPGDRIALRELLTDRVTIANPFDIHTYLWFDPPALQRVFSEACTAGYDAVGFMLDSPPEGKADTASFDAVIDVFIAARARRAVARGPDRLAARDHQRRGTRSAAWRAASSRCRVSAKRSKRWRWPAPSARRGAAGRACNCSCRRAAPGARRDSTV